MSRCNATCTATAQAYNPRNHAAQQARCCGNNASVRYVVRAAAKRLVARRGACRNRRGMRKRARQRGCARKPHAGTRRCLAALHTVGGGSRPAARTTRMREHQTQPVQLARRVGMINEAGASKTRRHPRCALQWSPAAVREMVVAAYVQRTSAALSIRSGARYALRTQSRFICCARPPPHASCAWCEDRRSTAAYGAEQQLLSRST